MESIKLFYLKDGKDNLKPLVDSESYLMSDVFVVNLLEEYLLKDSMIDYEKNIIKSIIFSVHYWELMKRGYSCNEIKDILNNEISISSKSDKAIINEMKEQLRAIDLIEKEPYLVNGFASRIFSCSSIPTFSNEVEKFVLNKRKNHI